MTEILIAGAAMAALCLAALYFLRREDEAIMAHTAPDPALFTPHQRLLLIAADDLMAARKRLQITEAELARLMDTPLHALTAVRNHSTVPTLDYLERMAGALGVTLIIKIGDENA